MDYMTVKETSKKKWSRSPKNKILLSWYLNSTTIEVSDMVLNFHQEVAKYFPKLLVEIILD